MMQADSLRTYSQTGRLLVDENGEIVGRTKCPADTDPGQALDRLAKQYSHEHPEMDYAEAWDRILHDPRNHDLVAAYASTDYRPKHVALPDQSPTPKRHGEDVDRAVRRYMAQHNTTDYAEALQAVLKADPPMANRYGEIADA